MKDQLPTETEALFLDHRAAELVEYLAPTEPEDVDRLLLPLWIMASRNSGVEEAGFVRRCYIEILMELPHFSLAKACHDFRTGRAGDGKWRPEAGEIYQRAEFHAKPYRTELAEIREVLVFAWNRSVASKTNIDRVAALICDVSNPGNKRDYAAPLAAGVEADLATKYHDAPLPKISEELREKLGVGAKLVGNEQTNQD